ncbi:MAG TPA: GYD domain-containing protein [candidate division Zixibacteria bacterium]|nr:GYD domain-containing protein [candidate division Zixibacteria bacterium]HER00171.1 GYD domain-containing protein [candidate division Zixibacteria bacterium]
MKTFVLMTKLAPQSASLIEVGHKHTDRAKCNQEWLDQINEQCPEVEFLAHYALMGTWDFMDIYQAPDERTAAKVSLITREYGACQVESWLAIPYDQIAEITKEIKRPEKAPQ